MPLDNFQLYKGEPTKDATIIIKQLIAKEKVSIVPLLYTGLHYIPSFRLGQAIQ